MEKLIINQKNNLKRNICVEKIGKGYIVHEHEVTGCNTYLLEGVYTYEQVKDLNALTTFEVGFGKCLKLGPIAFIGIPDMEYAENSGYFKYDVKEYGKIYDQREYYFEPYKKEEEARKIKNYTVYGWNGIEEVSKKAPVAKINYLLDNRYMSRKARNLKVFDMHCKLEEKYSYNQAKKLAVKNMEMENSLSNQIPIIFATIEGNHHVGIINMFPSDEKLALGFRDVWEYGYEEPKIQKIKFLSDEEAKKIKSFDLYFYEYNLSENEGREYYIEKYDRTFDNRFSFRMTDGSDYRLN